MVLPKATQLTFTKFMQQKMKAYFLPPFVLFLFATYKDDCVTKILAFYKYLRLSISCFTDATSQQECIAKVYNRPLDRPYIKRCSANGRRHSHLAFRIIFFVLCPDGVGHFTRVFHRLAVSYGSLFPMFSCAVFR